MIPADASKVRIQMNDQKQVSVDVLSGEARITNLKGVEVARVYPGEALSFTMPPVPQAGASGATKIAGCVEKVVVGGKTYYVLTDSTTKVRVQLQGSLVEALAGKYAEVEGSPNTTVTPIKDATQVVEVVKVNSEKKVTGCPHRGGAWSKTVGGVPVLLGGILIGGGTIGGLAAAGTFSGSSSSLAGRSVSTP